MCCVVMRKSTQSPCQCPCPCQCPWSMPMSMSLTASIPPVPENTFGSFHAIVPSGTLAPSSMVVRVPACPCPCTCHRPCRCQRPFRVPPYPCSRHVSDNVQLATFKSDNEDTLSFVFHILYGHPAPQDNDQQQDPSSTCHSQQLSPLLLGPSERNDPQNQQTLSRKLCGASERQPNNERSCVECAH